MILSRRNFLKITGASAMGMAAVAMNPVAAAAEEAAQLPMTAPEDVIQGVLDVQELPEAPAVWKDVVNKADPMRTCYSGAFRVPFEVAEGVTGESVVYIGDKFNMNQAIIFVVPQSGDTAENCIVENGWKKLADEVGYVVMVLQPSVNFSVDAVKAMVKRGGTRSHWFMPKGRAFIAGYGDGASLVMNYVPSSITTWAGVGLFGTPDVNVEELGLKLEVPVWMYTDDMAAVEPLTALLKKVNKCSEEMTCSADADQIWAPSFKTNQLLLNEQPISQVRVSLVGDPAANNATRTAKVVEFFGKYTRETGYGKKAIRYAMEIEDWGATRQTVEVDGITRSWIEYVPSNPRNTSENGCPLMLVLHGNALNGEYFVERSQYIRMAEEKGFVIAFPNGSINKVLAPTWNSGCDPEAWDDAAFLKAMIEDIKSRNAIDASRIYGYGHSLGGMTIQLFVNGPMAGVFAAASGTGCAIDLGATAGADPEMPEVKTPFCVAMGENDQWDASMGTEAADYCIKFWTENLGCEGEPAVYRNGRYRVYDWTDKNGVNTFSYTLVDGMPHTTTLDVGMTQYEWMSRFTREEDGSVGYGKGFYEAPKA